jgi:hypothetical protein
MTSRSGAAINLGPTVNLQGTHKFLSLDTGKKVKRWGFTVMPMPDLVIKKVERYADNVAMAGESLLRTKTKYYLNGTTLWMRTLSTSLSMRWTHTPQ